MRSIKARRLIPTVLFLLAASGCDSGVDGPIPSSASPTKAVATLKDDKPLLLMDVGGDADSLAPLKKSSKEVFLLRRAVRAVHEHGLKNPKFDGKESFTVREMRVLEKDEYNCPKWGSAKEVGMLVVDRAKAAAVKPDDLDGMPEDQLRGLFSSIQLTVEGLKG
jgi:hypothetical protein